MEKLTKSELYDYLEEQTFQNIIKWRRVELLRVIDGERVVNVFPQSNQRTKLLRDGVLTSSYGHGGKRLEVSWKARRMLERDV